MKQWDNIDEKAHREGKAILFLKSLSSINPKTYRKAYHPHSVSKAEFFDNFKEFKHPLRLLIYPNKTLK